MDGRSCVRSAVSGQPPPPPCGVISTFPRTAWEKTTACGLAERLPRSATEEDYRPQSPAAAGSGNVGLPVLSCYYRLRSDFPARSTAPHPWSGSTPPHPGPLKLIICNLQFAFCNSLRTQSRNCNHQLQQPHARRGARRWREKSFR
jgi:hypothetical protein